MLVGSFMTATAAFAATLSHAAPPDSFLPNDILAAIYGTLAGIAFLATLHWDSQSRRELRSGVVEIVNVPVVKKIRGDRYETPWVLLGTSWVIFDKGSWNSVATGTIVRIVRVPRSKAILEVGIPQEARS